MTDQVMAYCKLCQKNTLHLQPSTSHLLHLLLSFLTVGTWLPVWFIINRNNVSQGTCTLCGQLKGVFGSTRGGTKTQPTPESHIKCPDCAELIKREARVCMHCGCALTPQLAPTQNGKINCPSCQRETDGASDRCGFCYTPLKT